MGLTVAEILKAFHVTPQTASHEQLELAASLLKAVKKSDEPAPVPVSIPTLNKVLIVNPTYGDDTTADPGSQTLVFQTYAGAYAQANAGDIIILYPGDYPDDFTPSKNDITVYALPGVNFTLANASHFIQDNVGYKVTILGYGIIAPAGTTFGVTSHLVQAAEAAGADHYIELQEVKDCNSLFNCNDGKLKMVIRGNVSQKGNNGMRRTGILNLEIKGTWNITVGDANGSYGSEFIFIRDISNTDIQRITVKEIKFATTNAVQTNRWNFIRTGTSMPNATLVIRTEKLTFTHPYATGAGTETETNNLSSAVFALQHTMKKFIFFGDIYSNGRKVVLLNNSSTTDVTINGDIESGNDAAVIVSTNNTVGKVKVNGKVKGFGANGAVSAGMTGVAGWNGQGVVEVNGEVENTYNDVTGHGVKKFSVASKIGFKAGTKIRLANVGAYALADGSGGANSFHAYGDIYTNATAADPNMTAAVNGGLNAGSELI